MKRDFGWRNWIKIFGSTATRGYSKSVTNYKFFGEMNAQCKSIFHASYDLVAKRMCMEIASLAYVGVSLEHVNPNTSETNGTPYGV